MRRFRFSQGRVAIANFSTDFTIPYLHDALVMVQSKFTTQVSKPLPLKDLATASKLGAVACVVGQTAMETYLVGQNTMYVAQ